MEALYYLAIFFIFPGFLFSTVMGLMVSWIDRKVTARVQYRVGPPWYQNFADVLKLALYKETLIPKGVSRLLFFGMPVAGLVAATLVSAIVLFVNGPNHSGFIGDVVAVVYLMLIPPIVLMLGGFVSANSLASLGASREMKLMLSYELPFILALCVPLIKCDYSIKLADIILYQQSHAIVFNSLSGKISLMVILLCVQAKLGFVPFDMPEAETEIMAGPYIEYSGKALAVFKMTKAILFFVLPVFIITLYFGGINFSILGIFYNIVEYLLIVVVMIVVKNTNPRLRIDQAVGFFWGFATLAAVVSVILAYIGM